jgi:hypothetical protein
MHRWFSLIGKLDVLYVHCPKCSRAGRYRVQHLVEERGRSARVIDWLDEITADCPEASAQHERSMRRALPRLAEGAVDRAAAAYVRPAAALGWRQIAG